ncbi:unnamed protein product [Didymodactylos carnosus]|uniref:Uncharacterized protein n=1 Tax=Didymodactylos carnosus TaxID=1234261 RepID=A0A813TIC7_9BILA|nr:unnamed protein product [Didymodactylos carnosus]CAF1069320.1 unnamed protein product [Didymodactylos carnosus]CAF3598919.1 unnamed protein product [Didymodactylos carnosus]CAF3833868.1 unnamed protein product [Didymodactylos carnosus]
MFDVIADKNYIRFVNIRLGGCCSGNHEEDTLRIALFGLENSGKTTLIECLKTSKKVKEVKNKISTHGVVAQNLYLQQKHLLLFDCGGCKHQRHIWPHLLNNSDIIMFTVDSTDQACLQDAKDALFDLLIHESLSGKPLLIICTKTDKPNKLKTVTIENHLNLWMIVDRPVHKVNFSSVTLDDLTLITSWIVYYSNRKQKGKLMNLTSSIISPNSSLPLSLIPTPAPSAATMSLLSAETASGAASTAISSSTTRLFVHSVPLKKSRMNLKFVKKNLVI